MLFQGLHGIAGWAAVITSAGSSVGVVLFGLTKLAKSIVPQVSKDRREWLAKRMEYRHERYKLRMESRRRPLTTRPSDAVDDEAA